MPNKISSMLDNAADKLESRGMTKEAYAIDKVADIIDSTALPTKNPPIIIYYGLFFSPEEMTKLMDHLKAGQPLTKVIPDPHVTFSFRPPKEKYPPAEILGKEYPVRITGMGNNEINHGYSVEIPKELEPYYHNTPNKHITLSLSPTGKAVDTKNLVFKDIAPFTVIGKMGFNDGQKTYYNY